MCRFLSYIGAPVVLNKLLYEPQNSLIRQSYDAREIEEPLNGDGFGIGWYARDLHPFPAVFVSVTPAWNNRNLQYLAPKLQSDCVFAHVRAASVGCVSESNCHPFHYKQYLMMHNGGVENFHLIKRAISNRLSDNMFSWIRGQTDSEHIFALFIDCLMSCKSDDPGVKEIALSLESMIRILEEIKKAKGCTAASYLNLVITDGKRMVGCRYVSNSSETPLSLYFTRRKYSCEGNTVRLQDGQIHEKSVLIVSEKLTENDNDWETVPVNSIILVDENLEVTLEPITV